MSRPRKVVSQEEAQRFNSLRVLYKGRTFKYSDIAKLFQVEFGWKNYTLIGAIVNSIFIKVDRGVYAFPKEPVYIGKFQNLFDQLAEKRKQNYAEKKEGIESATVEIIDPISSAIKLLKENGYKVIKQKFNLEEALQNSDKPVGQFIITEEF